MTRLQEALSFRETFKQPIIGNLHVSNGRIRSLMDMQVDLIEEEAGEFFDAVEILKAGTPQVQPTDDIRRTEVLKELSDLVFVCYQFAACFGLDLDEALARVYHSNMSKLDESGAPIYREDGKVLKGPNYKKPNLKSLVE